MAIGWGVRPLQRRHGVVQMIDDARRRVPGLERGCIHEGLEGGSRLPARLNGAIEVTGTEVSAPDHGADLAGDWIHRHKSSLQWTRIGNRRSLFRRRPPRLERRTFGVDRLQRFGGRSFRGFLHRHVDRGIYAESALINALPSETFDKLLADLLLEVLAVR